MASLSPNATLVSSVPASSGDAVNVVRTYTVTLPTGLTETFIAGPCTPAHADNLASALADGGYLAAKNAGHLQADGIWA